MPDKIARIVSYLFHPLLMPTYAVLLLFNTGTYLQYMPPGPKTMIILLVFTGTFLIPVSLLPLWIFLGITKTIYLNNRQERFVPLFVTTIIYYVAFYLLRRYHLSSLILSIMMAGTILLFAGLIVSVWWKISLHMLGIGGLTGFLAGIIIKTGGVNIFIFSLVIILAGLLGVSRLKLNAHSAAEVYAGLFSGIIIGFITVIVY